MNCYRLEWPSERSGQADRWTLANSQSDARRTALRLMRSERTGAPWIRIVLTGSEGDVEDRFVTRNIVETWPADALLPLADPDAVPVATPEIDRLRARSLAGLDVVLEWSFRHKLIGGTGREALRLAFDAALLGISRPIG